MSQQPEIDYSEGSFFEISVRVFFLLKMPKQTKEKIVVDVLKKMSQLASLDCLDGIQTHPSLQQSH